MALNLLTLYSKLIGSRFRVHRSGLLLGLIMFVGNQILDETSYGSTAMSGIIIYILIGVLIFGFCVLD